MVGLSVSGVLLKQGTQSKGEEEIKTNCHFDTLGIESVACLEKCCMEFEQIHNPLQHLAGTSHVLSLL